jgi:hypothetical protein
MHGFLNLILATTWPRIDSVDSDALMRLLQDDNATSFTMMQHAIRWQGVEFPREQLLQTRDEIMSSFGSCSFDEPIEDLKQLGWLDVPHGVGHATND